MNIAQFDDAFYPTIDGVTIVVDNYVRNLNKLGNECVVVAPKYKDYIDDRPYTILRCKGFTMPGLHYICATPVLDSHIKKQLMEQDFDLFHVHSPFIMGRYALKIAREKNVPILTTFHTQYRQDFKKALKNDFLADAMVKYIVKFYNGVDKVWTLTNSVRKVLQDYGCTKEIEIMPNACDFEFPEDEEKLRAEIDEEFHLSGVENVFLFVGQMIAQKNIFLSVRAMKLLKDRGMSFQFLMVGTGCDEKKLIDLIEDLGLRDNVILTGRVTDRRKIAGLYLRSDVFVFPSMYDCAPLVKIEAAAHRTPSVLCREAVAAEGLVDFDNGYLIEESPEALADKLELIMRDREKLKEVSERAYETVYQSWEKVVQVVNAKYQDIVEEYRMKNGLPKKTN